MNLYVLGLRSLAHVIPPRSLPLDAYHTHCCLTEMYADGNLTSHRMCILNTDNRIMSHQIPTIYISLSIVMVDTNIDEQYVLP